MVHWEEKEKKKKLNILSIGFSQHKHYVNWKISKLSQEDHWTPCGSYNKNGRLEWGFPLFPHIQTKDTWVIQPPCWGKTLIQKHWKSFHCLLGINLNHNDGS